MSLSSFLCRLVLSLIPYYVLVSGWATDGTQFIAAVNRTQPITLAGKVIDIQNLLYSNVQSAVSPQCGPFNSTNFTEVNTGIQFNATKYATHFSYQNFF